VIDDELAAPGEQIRQGLLPRRPVKHVGLCDTLPRQLAPLAAELVALPQEVFFLGQQSTPGVDPFVTGYDSMVRHVITPC